MKKLIFLFLLFFPLVTFSQTTNQCTITWGYPVEANTTIDGFRFYVDGISYFTVTDPSSRNINCTALNLLNGSHTLELVAFNSVGESNKSNPVTVNWVNSIPQSPISLELIIKITP